jgi:archaemetzincin
VVPVGRLELALVPFYMGPCAGLLESLGLDLERLLGLQPRESPPWFDPEDAYDPSRGQYLSTRLLSMLDDGPGTSFPRVLGVTGADLFVPVLTYVFGEAQLHGRAAVVSIQRLRPEAYGLPPAPEVLARRLTIEAAHELGHCDGLLHCRLDGCVMRASTYVEEIDLKSAERCRRCGTGTPPAPAPD